jgi:DNA invertase Pin-like site-specific DNA recombinase
MTINRLGGYMVHPAAAIFPMMNDAELKELAENIKEHGLRQPIILNHDESILIDGRNRLRACEIADADITYEVLPEDYVDQMILDYIVSANIHRRHLTLGQRAMLATELEPMYAEAAKARQRGGQGGVLLEENLPQANERAPQARDWAAKAVGVSGKSVSDAKALKKETPDLADKVSNREMTLNGATKERKARSQAKPKAKPIAPPARNKKAAEIADLAEQGKTRQQIAKELGIGERTVRRELEDEAREQAAKEDAAVLDWNSIPGNQLEKLDRAKVSIRKELEKEFHTRLLAKLDQYKAQCDDNVAAFKAKLESEAQQARAMRDDERRRYQEGIEVYRAKGLIAPSDYTMILSCLHPDSRNSVSDEKLAAAFRLFNDSRLKTLLVKELT